MAGDRQSRRSFGANPWIDNMKKLIPAIALCTAATGNLASVASAATTPCEDRLKEVLVAVKRGLAAGVGFAVMDRRAAANRNDYANSHC
jgi:hypothetical protein